MSEAKMKADVTAGLAMPPFQPILTDAGGGHTFTMLGTTMRLIASAAGSGGRYTVVEQVTPPGWGYLPLSTARVYGPRPHRAVYHIRFLFAYGSK